MKRRTQVLGVAALVLCGAIAWPIRAHYRLRARLVAYQRELQAKGEKLTIAGLTPASSSEEVWAANALVVAANRLRTVVSSFTNQPPLMRAAAPGHVIAGWQQDPLPDFAQTNLWPGLSANLAAAEPTLAQVHATLQAPRLSFGLDYSQGFSVLLPHLAPIKSLSQWLSAETIFALHEHRLEDAHDSLVAQVALVQRYQGEPLLISALVRIAMGSIAVSTTWEALQAPGWSEPQLRDLQQAWSALDVLAQAEAALAMERAMGAQVFERGRVSYAAVPTMALGSGTSGSGLSELAQLGKEVLDDPKKGFQQMARRYPGYWKWKCWQSYDDELVNAQVLQAGVEALRAARQPGGLAPALARFGQTTDALLQAHPHAGAWLEYSPGDTIRGVLSRVAGFEMQRSLLVTAIALRRYQLRHGACPAQLSALVPDYLSEVPRDPMDGQPLRYRLNPDGSFLLYSIGEDGVDNGGDPKPSPGTPNRKAWYQARDVVWPSPATAQETKAYFDDLAAKRKPVPPPMDEALRRRYGVAPSRAQVTNTASR